MASVDDADLVAVVDLGARRSAARAATCAREASASSSAMARAVASTRGSSTATARAQLLEDVVLALDRERLGVQDLVLELLSSAVT
jgi:hypothetical protein